MTPSTSSPALIANRDAAPGLVFFPIEADSARDSLHSQDECESAFDLNGYNDSGPEGDSERETGDAPDGIERVYTARKRGRPHSGPPRHLRVLELVSMVPIGPRPSEVTPLATRDPVASRRASASPVAPWGKRKRRVLDIPVDVPPRAERPESCQYLPANVYDSLLLRQVDPCPRLLCDQSTPGPYVLFDTLKFPDKTCLGNQLQPNKCDHSRALGKICGRKHGQRSDFDVLLQYIRIPTPLYTSVSISCHARRYAST